MNRVGEGHPLRRRRAGAWPFDSDRRRGTTRRYATDYEERHEGQEAVILRTWWFIDDEENEAIAAELGPHTLKSREVHITKAYDNVTRWTIKADDAALVKHLLATSGLHEEEKAVIGPVSTVAELKAKIAALPEEAAPRTKPFAQRIEQDVPQGEAWRAVHALLDFPKVPLFSQYQRMQGG